MTRSLKITAMALCVAAACGAAQAQTPNGRTRDEVRQELASARRSGELFAGGESGLTFRELSPGRYPKQPVVAGPRDLRVAARQHVHASFLGQYSECAGTVGNEIVEVQRFGNQRNTGRFCAREKKHGVDEPRQPG